MKNKFAAIAYFAMLIGIVACHEKSSTGSGGGNAPASAPAPAPDNPGGLIINPPSAQIPVSQSTVLQAIVDGQLVAASWSVSNSSVGVLSSNQGQSVTFTAKSTGTVLVSANVNGQAATCQLIVLPPGATPPPTPSPSPSPSPSTPPTFPANLSLYNDAGGILGNPHVLLFTGGGLAINEESGSAVEGSKFMRATSGPGGFWGISLDKNNTGVSADAAALSAGALRFSIRLSRNITSNEGFNINLSDKSGRTVSVPLGRDPNCSQDLSAVWQDIVVPISQFTGIDLRQITVPFAIAVASPAGTSSITFDIDNVRWTANTAGAVTTSVDGVSALACP